MCWVKTAICFTGTKSQLVGIGETLFFLEQIMNTHKNFFYSTRIRSLQLENGPYFLIGLPQRNWSLPNKFKLCIYKNGMAMKLSQKKKKFSIYIRNNVVVFWKRLSSILKLGTRYRMSSNVDAFCRVRVIRYTE